jgi:hypothetical protein
MGPWRSPFSLRTTPQQLKLELLHGVTQMQGLARYAHGPALRRFAWVVVLGLAFVAFYSRTCWATEDEAQAKSSFEVFQLEWMKKVNSYGDYGQHNVKVETDGQGRYVASYRLIVPAEGSEVKSTGDKASPYVGVVKYEEQTFTSRADTAELAKQGPFKVEREVIITEIFRYTKGKWVF